MADSPKKSSEHATASGTLALFITASVPALTCVAPFGEYERLKGGREYRGVRTARHTYIRDLAGPWLLFDNETDPYQQHYLLGDPAAAQLQSDLDAQLQRKLKASADAFLPGADYIAKWGWPVDAKGTVPYTP